MPRPSERTQTPASTSPKDGPPSPLHQPFSPSPIPLQIPTPCFRNNKLLRLPNLPPRLSHNSHKRGNHHLLRSVSPFLNTRSIAILPEVLGSNRHHGKDTRQLPHSARRGHGRRVGGRDGRLSLLLPMGERRLRENQSRGSREVGSLVSTGTCRCSI